jgi:error-prone DNA polymerase
MSWLRYLTFEARWSGTAPASSARTPIGGLERDLDVIEERDFPGYFLIVEGMVRFARERRILCQGRGSAVPKVNLETRHKTQVAGWHGRVS